MRQENYLTTISIDCFVPDMRFTLTLTTHAADWAMNHPIVFTIRKILLPTKGWAVMPKKVSVDLWNGTEIPHIVSIVSTYTEKSRRVNWEHVYF